MRLQRIDPVFGVAGVQHHWRATWAGRSATGRQRYHAVGALVLASGFTLPPVERRLIPARFGARAIDSGAVVRPDGLAPAQIELRTADGITGHGSDPEGEASAWGHLAHLLPERFGLPVLAEWEVIWETAYAVPPNLADLARAVASAARRPERQQQRKR